MSLSYKAKELHNRKDNPSYRHTSTNFHSLSSKNADLASLAKDKEVQKAKDQLAALQAPILKSPLYMSVMQCICQGTDF